MILYSGTATGRDFLALELFNGQVRYVYDVGGGARALTVDQRHRVSVSDNRWHQVAITRSTLEQVYLMQSLSAPAPALLTAAFLRRWSYKGHDRLNLYTHIISDCQKFCNSHSQTEARRRSRPPSGKFTSPLE